MSGRKEHHRVTPDGKALGACTAALAERGVVLLTSQGLIDLDVPTIKKETCKSCASRPGTVPNGCEQTQTDFLKSIVDGKKFLCHAPKDGKICTGWIYVRAAYVERPFPKRIRKRLSKVKYSPPDDES